MTRQERFATPGHVEVRVQNKLGEVRFTTHAEPVTEVELRGHGAHGDEIVQRSLVEHQEFGGHEEVVVEVPLPSDFPWHRRGDVLVTVRLPQGASVDVETAAGKITAEGTLGATRAGTASGDVTLGSVDGDLLARSASGNITVTDVTGTAEIATASGSVRGGPLKSTGLVRTASGDVDLGSAAAHLTVETTSGDVTVGEVAGGCDLKTVSGDQRVRRLVAGEGEFKTVSGDLVIAVARGTVVVIDAESLSGSLSSEIELQADDPGSPPAEEETGPHAELRARTVSGDVRIQRAPA